MSGDDVPKVVGQEIVEVREMTPAEMAQEGWEPDNLHGPPVVLELEDGSLLFASADAEGNGPGELFGRKGYTGFYVRGQVKLV